MIRVNISGDKAIQATFKALVPKVQKSALAKLGAAIHDDVKQRIGKHTKSGALEQSLRSIKADGEYVIYNDLQRAPHARFVHWGTKPHVIQAKGGIYKSYKDADGKRVRKGIGKGGRQRIMLRWPVPGGFRFARKVNHPGYKGDDYFVKAAAEAPRMFARIVTQLQRELK
jgi:hypothetical protein